MRKALLTIVVLSLAGCSSDDGDKPEPCDLSHRTGSYVQHGAERANGTCGPLPDQVVRVDDPTGLPPNCDPDGTDELSDDKCSYSRSYTCTTAEGTSAVVGVITEHDRGDRLTAVMSITARDTAGAFVCASTYDVTFTRQ